MYWMLTRLCDQLSTTKTIPYLGSVTLICWWKHMCTSLHFFLFITNGVHFSWHHILKGKMLDGKQNKQLDHLLYILLHKAILFYKAKHWHQKYGLKGPDLEVQEREKMQVCGATFTLNDIQKVTSGHLYLIYSQSCPKHQHIVDIETYTCDWKFSSHLLLSMQFNRYLWWNLLTTSSSHCYRFANWDLNQIQM